jgi:hypothetical protein
MSRRPITFRNIPADREAVEQIVGPVLGKRSVPNPTVTKYAYVLRFPGSKVITSQRLMRVLDKIPNPKGEGILLAGDFTIEALAIAARASCDVVSSSEPFWTDDRYLSAWPH